jgi:hypothetical protein
MMAVWFKPKRYGFGPTPVSWQGWLLTLVYFAVVLAATWMFLPKYQVLPMIGWPQWLALVGGATAAMTLISLRTTDGAWRWRWGDGHDKKKA